MVNEGLVKPEDKEGNDVSDKAADKGAERTDVVAAAPAMSMPKGTNTIRLP